MKKLSLKKVIGFLFGILGNTQKLKEMPKEEIFFRIKGVIFKYFEYFQFIFKINELSDFRYYRAITILTSNRNLDDQIYHLFLHGARDLFFTETYVKEARLKLIKKLYGRSAWISEANQILKGKLNLLGHTLKIPQAGEWHVDPLENKEWPKVFYAYVKKNRRVKNWDIKYIWELNRHQYLIVLGKAYWITGDEKYAEKVVSIIKSWIDTNPYNMGVNWTSSLELAVRVISWLWAYSFCRGSRHLTVEFHKIFSKSIYEHAKYIENHLSYYSSPYNHLIGEGAALHLIGSLFPHFNCGKQWESLGWTILAERIDDQFCEDGMSVEKASFYHHFTLGFYLQSVFLRRINNKKVPEKVLHKIEKALEFSMHLTRPDGLLPMIGDIDNARSLYFYTQHSWDFRGFLSLGTVLFNRRPDFKYQSNGYSEELIWLGTDNDIDQYENTEATAPSVTSIPFFKSGYFISRDSWNKDSNYLCFDCGEIAAGLSEGAVPSAAHGHADSLSFDLAAHGQSFIVDRGFFTYFGNKDWHKHFRLEEAHNAVLVGNYRQAEYYGRLTWRNVKRPKLNCWESTDDYDAVTGSISYNASVSHIRQMITVKKHFWILRDAVKASQGENDVQSFLHFAPEVDLSLNNETREIFASRGPYGLLIKHFYDAKVCIKKGGDRPSDGWSVPGYGMRLPAWTVKIQWPKDDSIRSFAMLFIPVNKKYQKVRILAEKSFSNSQISKIEFSINTSRFSVNTNQSRQTQFSIGSDQFSVDFQGID